MKTNSTFKEISLYWLKRVKYMSNGRGISLENREVQIYEQNSNDFVMYPNINFPSFPQFPRILNETPEIPGGKLPSMPDTNPTVKETFSNMMEKISEEVREPYKIAIDMQSGKRPFDATELVISMMEAEQKLLITTRVINDTVKGLKQLENISA